MLADDPFAPSIAVKADQEGGFFGYASVFNVQDLQGDRVQKGAFLKNLAIWREKKKYPLILWQHDPHQPIGFCEALWEDAIGLAIRGRLLMKMARAREAWALLQSLHFDGLSIGYKTVRALRQPQGRGRILCELDLREISLVTFAANPYATACPLRKDKRLVRNQ